MIEQELTIVSYDRIKLRGVLTEIKTPKALVITVHGSFNQDRDGNLDEKSKWMYPQGAPKRNLFFDIAQALSEVHVATFRYDKRASGESEGIYKDTTLTVLANDVKAILESMRSRFPSIAIGILGQSEGCLTAIRAWELGARPDFIILQGPPLQPFDQTLEYQRNRAAKPFLNDKSGEISRKYPYAMAFYQAMYKGDMLDQIKNTHEQHYTLRYGNWSAVTSLQKYREYMWDASEMLKDVTCSVTIFFGLKDQNVSTEHLKIIENGKKLGFYKNVTLQTFANLEHSFREFNEGDDFFKALSKPISSIYLSALIQNIQKIIN